MNTLIKIKLNASYKSFDTDFEVSLTGSPIILSGVNGGGKSQLIDIIRGFDSRNAKNTINSTITIDGSDVDKGEINYRSFKENLNIPDIGHTTTRSNRQSRDNVWNHYDKHKLDKTHQNVKDFKKSCEEAKKLLSKEFSQEKFDQGLTQVEINTTPILRDFVWRNDDVFANSINQIFGAFASSELQGRAEAGDTTSKFEPSTLGTPPWVELNTLFKALGFSYRFKEDYHVDTTTFELNEEPAIFALNNSGEIDLTQRRELPDLSEGEKAIISFSFGSLIGESVQPKLLLLDELDATLNPSLIEAFFKILQTYFIDKGTTVILTTHSPVTIALAPKSGTKFYEIFRNIYPERILEVLPGEYSELEGDFLEYLKRYKGESKRNQSLIEQKNLFLTKLGTDKPQVYLEGVTDIDYLIKAAEHLDKNDLIKKFDLIDGTGCAKMGCEFKNFSRVVESGSKPKNHHIYIFDADTNKQNKTIHEHLHQKVLSYNRENSLKKGIENLFGEEIIKKAHQNHPNLFTYLLTKNGNGEIVSSETIITSGQKSNLCKWVCENGDKNDFSGFEEIFNILETVVVDE